MNERELLVHYKQTGDLATLGKLYSPYMSLLYGVCFKYLEDADESQDAVMQIFEELISKLRVHEVESFKSWLYVFARNFCLMKLRKGKRNVHVDLEDHLSEMEQRLDTVDEKQWREEDFEKMEGCLQQLNKDQEVCVRMFYLEQQCYAAIADAAGFELAQVKSFIQNGKRNLKICMEKKHYGK